jgi:hypothetical protein
MGGPRKKKAKSKRKGGRHVHEMRIRHAANGGYIVRHEFRPRPGEIAQEPEEHAVPDLAALQDHVGEHMETPPPQAQGPGGMQPAEALA